MVKNLISCFVRLLYRFLECQAAMITCWMWAIAIGKFTRRCRLNLPLIRQMISPTLNTTWGAKTILLGMADSLAISAMRRIMTYHGWVNLNTYLENSSEIINLRVTCCLLQFDSVEWPRLQGTIYLPRNIDNFLRGELKFHKCCNNFLGVHSTW